jgi:PAS domain S-box-containing protein
MAADGRGRLHSEEAPRLPEHWLKLLLENISDSVLVIDRNGIIRHWNRGAATTFQYSKEEIVGEPFNLLYVPTEGEELQEAWNLAFDGEIISDVEVTVKRKDAKLLSILLSIVPIIGDTGEVDYLAGIAKDITLIRGLEERVLASKKLETVREMIVTLNHKMNQPLAVATVYLGLLQDEGHEVSPSERKEFLREIEVQIDRIAALMRRIAEMEEIRTVEYLGENRMVDVAEEAEGED